MSKTKSKTRSPWAWIPSLYFAEGLPYVVVMTVAVIMYKRLGISNTDIALYTSWLYLPWVIKPFWSPLVDILKSKRWWIVTMQLFIGAGLAGVAFTIPTTLFFQSTLAFFWLLAFSSATHDIAADGFYMHGIDDSQQAYFIGIRSTFYRLAMITGQGLLIILAGFFEVAWGVEPVEIKVSASQEHKKIELLAEGNINESEDDYYFILDQTDLFIETGVLRESEFDSIINQVENNNAEKGFVLLEEEKEEEDKEDSWWDRSVVDPLERFIKTSFGSDKYSEEKEITKGNVGLVNVKLSREPEKGEEIVLNLSRKKGNESINLISSERLVFTNENWDEGAVLLFQVDPKMKKSVSSIFIGRSGNIPMAWSMIFVILAVLFLLFTFYHKFALPYPKEDEDKEVKSFSDVMQEFGETIVGFFVKKDIWVILGVLLTYRLGESQLVKMASPFLLDGREVGGLGLSTSDVGIVYGTIGVLFLTIGGILGGYAASRKGLKYWLWPMVIAINLPNLVYVYLSYALPESFVLVCASVAVEQFGYGFGFTAYMLYQIYVSEGKHKTAHFAFCTAFMAFGMMVPGMVSGWIQEMIGYQHFFIWVIICTIPSFIMVKLIKIDPQFGIKKK
ncbi:MFS transporter [Marinifilum fragile]|uniref:MFS transporter n=1 Tax=Marinifilum fragile TaxID=570161 RepID=UPI002AA5FD31|nr:MFS transporter [Marinifilum fragile]